MDERIHASRLLEDLAACQQYAFHPMLVPCVMLSAGLRMAVERRHLIKELLAKLEATVQALSLQSSQQTSGDTEKPPDLVLRSRHIESALELLSSCRRAQASRDGRYDFWNNFHRAVEAGLVYADVELSHVPRDSLTRAQNELRRWTALASRKFESMKARDSDHIARVDIASQMVIAT